MSAGTYLITVKSNEPPKIFLGDKIGGAEVVEMKRSEDDLMSSSQLALKYNVSVQTVRRKLSEYNQGSDGKFLYNPLIADEILRPKPKKKAGARRIN